MDNNIPNRTDPQWTQYVLGQFQDNEMDNQYPRVEGLRRVAHKLLGGIVEEGCDLLSEPNNTNGMRACAKAWIVFSDGYRFEALADAHPGNCIEDFTTYLVAMADTRAKGRAFRNALMLQHVVSAEEINKSMSPMGEIQPGGSIHSGQIAAVNLIIERLKDVSLVKVLDDLQIDYKSDSDGKVNLKLLSYEDSVKLLRQLNVISDEKFAQQKGSM